MNTMLDYKIHYQSGQDNSEDYYLRSLKYIKYNLRFETDTPFVVRDMQITLESSFTMLWSEKFLGQIRHYEE